MQFLYGNHVLKSGLGRITEATAAYTGVVVYSMADVPLGFGVAAKSTQVHACSIAASEKGLEWLVCLALLDRALDNET
jgi:ribosome biogenesis protein Nip4